MRSVYLFNDDLENWKSCIAIIRHECIISKLATFSSGCMLISPKRQQMNRDFIHSPAFHEPGV